MAKEKRVTVSWAFPAGQFFKCVLKHLRNAGLSSPKAVVKFKRLVPCYQQAFNVELESSGKARVTISDNMIQQRADKGSRRGYESEWPDRNPSTKIYWDAAASCVHGGKPIRDLASLSLYLEGAGTARKKAPGSDDVVGYGTPPRKNQFVPGQSGNPAGRPKGPRNRSMEVSEDYLLDLRKRLRDLTARVEVLEVGLEEEKDPTELPRTMGDLDAEEAQVVSAVQTAVQEAYKRELMPAEGRNWSKAPSLTPLAPSCAFYLEWWKVLFPYLPTLPEGWDLRRVRTSLVAWASEPL